MSVRQVAEKEYTKDGRKWVYEIHLKDRKIKSKKFATKREALEAERDYYNKHLNVKRDQSDMTLGELFEAHYEYQKDKVKYTTLHNYGKKIKHFTSISDIKLDKLNINDIEKWRKEVNDKDLATRTKNDLMKYLKSVLNYGTKWLDFNFSSMYLKMGNFNNPNELKKEMEYYTPEEFKKFISAEDDIKYKALFETLYYCGLRRGELRGLMWSCLDLENKELTVKQNVVNISGDHGYWQLTTPKTRTSNRVIPMPDILVNDLKILKENCQKYYGFDDGWFVFGDITPIHPDVLRRRKNELAAKAGVKQIRIHDFRHSCASLLINNGANITIVAKYLGHAKIDETLNTYSHMFKGKLNDIVSLINTMNEQE